jgi:hypothetical protein
MQSRGARRHADRRDASPCASGRVAGARPPPVVLTLVFGDVACVLQPSADVEVWLRCRAPEGTWVAPALAPRSHRRRHLCQAGCSQALGHVFSELVNAVA